MAAAPYALRLEGVSKRFPRTRHVTLFRMLKSISGRGAGDEARPFALERLDLEIPRGAIVGIIGENGAGKTTLLKTIAGLYLPSEGTVTADGDVALLAGLGAGMVDDLSVEANIWLYGAICWIRRSTIRARFDEILQWADLEGLASSSLRTLSTGMRTRLAFAIAMQVESETVLLDEAFTGGDKRFQEKCYRFFGAVSDARRTFLVATHNLEFVRRFCTSTLWLHRGQKRAFGPTAAVLDEYLSFEAK